MNESQLHTFFVYMPSWGLMGLAFNMFDLFPEQELQDYPIFGKFSHYYGGKVTSICHLLTKFKIHIYTLEKYLACADNLPKIEDVDNQLFACFVKNDTPHAETTVAGIVFTQSLIDELELTESEQFAAISHEIGHILYFYLENKDSYPCEEVYADSVASRIGLKDLILSVIDKLICCGKYHDLDNQLRMRKLYISNTANYVLV